MEWGKVGNFGEVLSKRGVGREVCLHARILWMTKREQIEKKVLQW
ncbi:hypothetical protein KTT_42690 [Tengunoibacter tsumagoiensis]|uniref:Uncharacterized protein n=1 Tax=Tengunoibacter tsumagoiensis TaxID=2014871 RepID=A0A402A5N1_9CHLR|nr:hypothetical protein KTT_42690 [Tengunoibacter tsumagoiensis]